MLTEQGRVVAVDADHLWVETINRSACGACSAASGCGQSLLARWAERSAFLQVALEGRPSASFRVGDQVRIGIPEDAVVTSSLLLYCVPLVSMLALAAAAQTAFGSELATASAALLGLIAGGLVVKLYGAMVSRKARLQPILLDLLAADSTGRSRGSSSEVI